LKGSNFFLEESFDRRINVPYMIPIPNIHVGQLRMSGSFDRLRMS
jgi:hypothetical protein